MKDFIKILQKQRKKQGLSCRKLGFKAGCTGRAISYWENGQREISLKEAEKVMNALGMDLVIVKRRQ